jgi:N-methylhydantoinase A
MRHSLEMRYAGQDFSMPVPIGADLLARADREAVMRLFNAIHQRAFGYHDPGRTLEIVSVRLAAVARRSMPGSLQDPQEGRPKPPGQDVYRRPVWFDDRPIDCPVYQRERLAAGSRFEGPAIVQEYASTTLIGPRDQLEVAPTGELLIRVSPK